MLVRLVNPRGRVVLIDDREVRLNTLLQQGFALAPEGFEATKAYNPVFDRGQKGANEQKDMGKDPRTSISSQVLGDVLGVIWM